MNQLFINLPVNERIVQALCWTLVHSLWQGVLLAVVTGLVILLTRRSRPGLRYGLFSALFFLFFLGSCLTFLRQWDRAGSTLAGGIVIRTEDRVAARITPEKGVDGAMALPVQGNWMEGVVNYFNEHAYFIVALWLLFFSLRLVRIMAQLGAQQRLRHYRVHSPSAYWTERLGELASRLKIKVRVRLLESEIIKIPVVTGFIKPVILLPFSILSQLSPSQVEAILLHELAHIRRRDYMVNLLFSLGEMFFFFNPGVLWICSLIREERENCCDDIAVGHAGSKKEFISALVSFQDHDRKAGRYAIAFPGSGEHLLQRVRRIVYRDNKTLDSREKFFLICCFLISGALLLAFTHAAPQDRSFRPQRSGRSNLVLSRKSDTTGRDLLPGRENLAGENDRVERYPDGKERSFDTIPPAPPIRPARPKVPTKAMNIEKVRPMPPESKDTLSDDQDREEEQMDREQQKARVKQRIEISKEKEKLDQQDREEEREISKMRHQPERDTLYLDKEEQKKRMKMEEQQRKDQRQESAERQEEIDRSEKKIEAQQDRLNQEEKRIARESRRIEEQSQRIEEEKQRIVEQKLMIEDQEFKKAATKINKRVDANDAGALPAPVAAPAISVNPQIKVTYAPNPPQHTMQVKANRKLLTPIIEELMQEHLIDDKEVVSFSLSDNEFIVNGVRQSDDIFRRFREKYIHDVRDRVSYSRKKDGSESTEIIQH